MCRYADMQMPVDITEYGQKMQHSSALNLQHENSTSDIWIKGIRGNEKPAH